MSAERKVVPVEVKVEARVFKCDVCGEEATPEINNHDVRRVDHTGPLKASTAEIPEGWRKLTYEDNSGSRTLHVCPDHNDSVISGILITSEE